MAHHSASPTRTSALLVAISAGVFVTLAEQVLLNNRDMKVGAIWQNLAGGGVLNLRAAVVWWVIAGSALVIGAVVASVLSRLPPPWEAARLLRWILSAAGLFVLAHIGHAVGAVEGIGPLAQLGGSAFAILLAALMAAFGAIFALRT